MTLSMNSVALHTPGHNPATVDCGLFSIHTYNMNITLTFGINMTNILNFTRSVLKKLTLSYKVSFFAMLWRTK